MFLLDPFKEKLFWNLLKSLEMVLFLEHQAAAAARALARYLSWYANLIWRVHVRFTLVIISCWEGPPKTLPPFVGIFLLLFSSNVESSIFHANWLAWLLQSVKMDKNLEKSSNFRSHIIKLLYALIRDKINWLPPYMWNEIHSLFLLYYFYFPWITFVFLRGCEWVTTCDRA